MGNNSCRLTEYCNYSHGETSFTNNTQIGKKVAIRFDSGRKLPQEKGEDIIDRARNLLSNGPFSATVNELMGY